MVSASGMPKPWYSVLDDPRPTPSSNRPPLRWSSIATRSATRAGWFTGGVMLKMPEPEMDPLGARRDVAHEHLVRRDVRVLLEEVVLGEPAVLEPDAVRGDRDLDLVEQAPVLGRRVASPASACVGT